MALCYAATNSGIPIYSKISREACIGIVVTFYIETVVLLQMHISVLLLYDITYSYYHIT